MSNPPPKKTGRPRKGDEPLIDYNTVDKLLVYGEVIPAESGPGTAVSFPSLREIADRFGVSSTLIGNYAKKHDCIQRRARAALRTQARVEEKIVERRAHAIAMTKEEEIEIIDIYLGGFKEALAEGRVRYDNPTDYNTMARLKEFLQGGADSRQEMRPLLTLEQLQARHREAQRMMAESSLAERGDSTTAQLRSAPVENGSTGQSVDEAGTSAPLVTQESGHR